VACCRANGFSPSATHTAHSIASQLAMVACGIGVAVVPANAAHHATAPLADIRFLPFRGSAIIELAAVWPASTSNPCVEEFLAAAETAAACS
jgi:DNA-binding transcriptional LysR family regulator